MQQGQVSMPLANKKKKKLKTEENKISKHVSRMQ